MFSSNWYPCYNKVLLKIKLRYPFQGKTKTTMSDISNGHHNNDTPIKGATSEASKHQSTNVTSSNGSTGGGEMAGIGSDTSSVGSTRKFYRSAEKR